MSVIKVFLAGRIEEKERIDNLAIILKEHGGFEVVSRWHMKMYWEYYSQASKRLRAIDDIEDLVRCDVLVRVLQGSGLKERDEDNLVAFGIALGFGKGVVIYGDGKLGEDRLMYSYLPEVLKAITLPELIVKIRIAGQNAHSSEGEGGQK